MIYECEAPFNLEKESSLQVLPRTAWAFSLACFSFAVALSLILAVTIRAHCRTPARMSTFPLRKPRKFMARKWNTDAAKRATSFAIFQ
ncbi:hypothetical protein BDW68DRAFT_14171 [Aspergillus falconensis]